MKILAIDVGGSYIKTGLLTLSAPIASPDSIGCIAAITSLSDISFTSGHTIPTRALDGVDAVIDDICDIAARHSDIVALGISFASQIDPHTGVVTSATETFPNFSSVALAKILEERLMIPVAIDNDVNCAAIAEGRFGDVAGKGDFLCLTFGTGIGGALMLDGRLYYGERFAAGEVGHMTTHGGGLSCNCGKRGCYEAYASTSALIDQAMAKLGEQLSGRELCTRLERGDSDVCRLMESWVDEVVYGLSSCIHMLNIKNIVLGGGIMENKTVFSMVRSALQSELLENFRCVNIHAARLGNSAGLIGAGLIALSRL